MRKIIVDEKSNNSNATGRKGRSSSLVKAAKAIVGVLGILALVITVLGIFYIARDPQGAMTVLEKFADTTRTPFPTHTPQPTILITQIHEVTREVTKEVTREVTVVVTASPPSYSECGAVIFEDYMAEKDIYGQSRPTRLLKEEFSWGPTTLVEVAACFTSDEGKKSDPHDIEEGYENKVAFYDIYGKPYIYRIIVGGRNRALFASRDDLIFVDFGTGRAGFITYDEFERGTQDIFKSRGSRQIAFEFYVTDNAQGNLSEFFMKLYPNSEIFAQIVEAIKTGEGFPEEVPDDFFIWATSVGFPAG